MIRLTLIILWRLNERACFELAKFGWMSLILQAHLVLDAKSQLKSSINAKKKRKRYIFLESTAFENLQSKNAWKLLNIYLNGTAGLLGPITIHSRRNKATRWDMFSCFPLSSFPSLCSQKEHGIHAIQPHLTKTRVNETFYQHQGSIFISCSEVQAVFRFPYKSQTGFVIWLCG